MRKINLKEDSNRIDLFEVGQCVPIFAKRHGKLVGMVMRHFVSAGDSWFLKMGGFGTASGYYETRRECLEDCSMKGYEFFIEDTG